MLVAIRYVQQRHLAENIRIKQLCELQPGMHSGDIWRKMLELNSSVNVLMLVLTRYVQQRHLAENALIVTFLNLDASTVSLAHNYR